MAKKKTAKVVEPQSDTKLFCIDGGCVWIMTAQGWEHFEACGEDEDCSCPDGPPTLKALADVGQAIITVCDYQLQRRGGSVLSRGFITLRTGFSIDPAYSDDYCLAISMGPGTWRYGHRGANRTRPQRTGHLDETRLPRGVALLDRLNTAGNASLELCGIGLLEPIFECDDSVSEELNNHRSKHRKSKT
jgi:hypothetical protein